MGSYGFSCGYCDVKLDTPYDDNAGAEEFAHKQGWRITMGPSTRWGFGANNTCPNCIPIGADPKDIIPLFVASEIQP